MKQDESILVRTRKSLDLEEDNKEFDSEILSHINMSLAKLRQNGIGTWLIVTDEESTWGDLVGDFNEMDNEFVGLIPTFVFLNVKLLFDPPPPSSVEYHIRFMDETLWRLRLAYDREVIDNDDG